MGGLDKHRFVDGFQDPSRHLLDLVFDAANPQEAYGAILLGIYTSHWLRSMTSDAVSGAVPAGFPPSSAHKLLLLLHPSAFVTSSAMKHVRRLSTVWWCIND